MHARAMAMMSPSVDEGVHEGELTVAGQGVVTFFVHSGDSATVLLYESEGVEFPRVSLHVGRDDAAFYWEAKDGAKQQIEPMCEVVSTSCEKEEELKCTQFVPDGITRGVSQDNRNTQYWFSIDSWNKTLRYGKGEMRLANVLAEVKYDHVLMFMNEDKHERFPKIKKFKSIRSVHADLCNCWTEPIVREPAVAVVADGSLTMDQVAASGFIIRKVSAHDHEATVQRVFEIGKAVFSSLSTESQRLYGNISGFSLDADFVSALEFSLRCYNRDRVGNINPLGLACKILKRKLDDSEFDTGGAPAAKPNPSRGYEYKETYLRITLGSAQGDSPGVLYVMEIWPGGCGSPIHDHGGTYAIIKVLHGQINIDLHRQLPLGSDPVVPVRQVSFEREQITMITPEANQIHRLRNLKQHTSSCITIQCYTYPDRDNLHDPYFHYVEAGKPGDFNPLTDWDFLAFKRKILCDWISAGSPPMLGEALEDMWWQTYVPPKAH